MTNDRPIDADGSYLKERHEHLHLTVHRYVAEIEEVLKDVKNGEFGHLKALPQLRRELLSTSKQLRDAEIQIDEQYRKTSGAGAPGDFDLAKARRDIGRKLDRLRETADTGHVSEVVD